MVAREMDVKKKKQDHKGTRNPVLVIAKRFLFAAIPKIGCSSDGFGLGLSVFWEVLKTKDVPQRYVATVLYAIVLPAET